MTSVIRFNHRKAHAESRIKPPVEPSERIILALDSPDLIHAQKLLDSLHGMLRNVKVGPALFIREGPRLIEILHQKKFRVFLDLKLHDIPNTVALGVKGAKDLGVWMLSVHLCGGRRMLAEAAAAAGNSPILAGITVLTSLDDLQAKETGISMTVEAQVLTLARLGKEVGLKAVVCSGREIGMLQPDVGTSMMKIVPGIRLETAPLDDQNRTMTPVEAIKAGADYLVVGRPVLSAEKPREALRSILHSIAEVSL